MSDATVLAANLRRVRQQIAEAAERCSRRPDEITLVGVTKYVDAETTGILFDCGLTDLGESRPQALWEKAAALADRPVRWHLVGHLQRNKVKRTLPHLGLLHSGDSLRLLEEVSGEAVRLGKTIDALLEVNTSGDAAKHGFSPDALQAAWPRIAGLPGLQIRGLMTMASLTGGAEKARRDFAALRRVRDELQQAAPPQVELRELSMGMSGDFAQAIAEGATIVRIGTALWEGLGA